MLRVAPWLHLVLFLLVAPAAHAGAWQRPVDGPVLRAFAFGRDPYAGGWHRGVDLAAARGSPVRSACAGRVTFAGRVPRGGRTVSVRCGAIAATYQQLGSLAVRAGADVARGARLGEVGASSDPRQRRSHVHLGARELATGRYLDPLDLLRAAPPALPLVPPAARTPPRAAPLGPAPRTPPRIQPVPETRAPWAAPRPGVRAPWAPPRPGVRAPWAEVRAPWVAPRPGVRAPWVAPRPGVRAPWAAPRLAPGSPRGEPEPGVPWPVWVGLASIAVGLPFGGLVRVRRRRLATTRVARTA